ncbi:hypothetical protein HY948_03780 [Candidatus Gottesmanbacteria bacterium]|nr:hypothetical protein [Candidatus Gottesmanbacteria bacterium]
MAIANEQDVGALCHRYETGEIPDFPSSFHRALFVACKIYAKEFTLNVDALFPRVYFVSLPNRSDGEVYLVHEGKAYCHGIIDPDNESPEFDVAQLTAIGDDKTIDLLGTILSVLDGQEDDENQFLQVADSLPWGRQHLLILLAGATTRMLERHYEAN